jgi:hypothetical protein
MAFTIDELCKRCLDSSAKVSDLLREAKVIASRRGIQELQDWVNDELTGYVSGRWLPDYRKVVGDLKYSPDGRRWGGLEVPNRQFRDMLSHTWLRYPVDELEQYVGRATSGDVLVVPFPQELIAAMAQRGFRLPSSDMGLEVTLVEFARILAAVRTELLTRLLAANGGEVEVFKRL